MAEFLTILALGGEGGGPHDRTMVMSVGEADCFSDGCGIGRGDADYDCASGGSFGVAGIIIFLEESCGDGCDTGS